MNEVNSLKSSKKRKLVVINAVGLDEGGTLSVARQVVSAAARRTNIKFLAFVNNKGFYDSYQNVKYIEVPLVKKSWLFRIWFEFFVCFRIAKRLNFYSWFSIQDISSRIGDKKQFVYCHNPTVLYSGGIKDMIFQPKVFLFSLFYKYLYGLNISANDSVFVQQTHMYDYFTKTYCLNNVIISRPFGYSESSGENIDHAGFKHKSHIFRFFYPTLPRTFKNIEILIRASKLLLKQSFNDFEFVVTVSEQDGLYARYLMYLAKDIPQVKFVGRLSHRKVMDYYQDCDALVFPSKLETWGLPLSEAKALGVPIIASDLPYVGETLGSYERVLFFDPFSAESLVMKINHFVSGGSYDGSKWQTGQDKPVLNGWDDLLAYVTGEDSVVNKKDNVFYS